MNCEQESISGRAEDNRRSTAMTDQEQRSRQHAEHDHE
jgi:hypothetical protein